MPHPGNEPVHVNLLPDSLRPDVPTTVLEGYIGEVTEESVTFFPRLDRHYSIELRRADVMDFETGLPSGVCRFIVPMSAPVQERITIRTIARRRSVAARIVPEAGGGDPDEWTQEAAPR